ncbi:LysE family translocator [Sulfurospirillum sp. hDNRA2]|uniref:LysE family translocator n=1 Tax=Sulfurospirillum sp. hDNRA2 TaxID=3237298 RepID=UPI0020B71213|nr:LysE family translocator [Sulfurospirillum sp. DNRA8]MCP3651932.1 LysE family translocator [Sulfurospirillum sp. DNRA8]MCR1810779.1 LysE family translocator [Sulfurospirillum sp. DNRA8]
MSLYLLFLVMATLTVLSPGPGVVMTLTNALRYGVKGTVGGILGIAFGALLIAAISATSLGIVLATSALLFTVLKFIGALYLLYLGLKLWKAPPLNLNAGDLHKASFSKRFFEGLSLQLTNPKAIFFFLSIFPQFIDKNEVHYIMQFSILVLTYSSLVILIHCLYAFFARKARTWLTSERGGRLINKGASITFMFFGFSLATAKQ